MTYCNALRFSLHLANLFLIYCKLSLKQLVTKVAIESFPQLLAACCTVGRRGGGVFAWAPAISFRPLCPFCQFAWLVTSAKRNLRAFCILVVSLRCINNCKHPAPFFSQSVAPFLLFQCAICMYEKHFPATPYPLLTRVFPGKTLVAQF